MKQKNEQTELSYYGLYLLKHLRDNHFPQANDSDFSDERAEVAARTYEQARRDGQSATNAHELAMAVMTKGLNLSKWNVLHDVVENEFAFEVADDKTEAFVEKLLPLVDPVFSIYDLADDGFADSPDYDFLYTELTGAVALYIEDYGV